MDYCEKFEILFDFYKANGELLKKKDINIGRTIYAFQLRLFRSLNRNGTYRDYIEEWEERLKELPVWPKLENHKKVKHI